MTDIVERLRGTTEQMACTASVDMALWDKHSNACLEAADEIERLRESLEWLRATFRLNMIRAYPNMPHEEIDERIKFVEEYPNRTSWEEK